VFAPAWQATVPEREAGNCVLVVVRRLSGLHVTGTFRNLRNLVGPWRNWLR
jgi:hypothetical protein